MYYCNNLRFLFQCHKISIAFVRIFNIVILILLCNTISIADSLANKIDSLETKLKFVELKDRAKILNKLSDAYLDISLEKSRTYSRKALQISIEDDNYKEKANAYINFANASWYDGITDSVLYFYKISLKIYEEVNDSSGIADSYNRMALVYEHTNDYDRSIDYMLQSLIIYQKMGNSLGEARVHNNIGIIYNNTNQSEEALIHYKRALFLFKQEESETEEARVINNIGTIYFEASKIDSAIIMILEAIKIHKRMFNKKALASEYSNLGILYSEKSDYQLSDDYFDKALVLQKEIKNQYGISSVENEIANKCFNRNQYDKAISFYRQSIAIKLKINDTKGLSDIYQSMSSLYDTISNPVKALKYHKLYVEALLKVFNLEKEEQIADITTKYKTEEKIKENILLQKKIENKKKAQWILSLISIALLFISVIAIISIRLKTKLLKQNKLNYKQKEELSQLSIQSKINENKRLQAEAKQKEIEKNLLEEDIKKQQKINELQREKHKQAIEHKNKELVTSTMHIVNKNQVLTNIKRSIEGRYNLTEIEKNNLKPIILEINSNINLDNDWDDFKMHFEEVNNDFFSKLQSRFPKLTKNDYKLCAYMRMNLSSKEIAQILNITLSAVSKSRNRLRKKMNLDSSVKLTRFMMDL